MPDTYKGFRIFNTKLTHYNSDALSSVFVEYENDGIMPSGRLLDHEPAGGEEVSVVGFYPNDVTKDYSSLGGRNNVNVAPGVRAMLETACEKLVKKTDNGCGWRLDTDLYRTLNKVDGTDPMHRAFRVKNPALWTGEDNNPATGDYKTIPSSRTDMPDEVIPTAGNVAPKSVRLVPCRYVYAMFFINDDTGYRLMIALNYIGMHSYYNSSNTSYVSDDGCYTNTGGYNDCGWLYNHVHDYFGTGVAARTRVGGFMMSMIPPEIDPSKTQDRFHPEWSISSENFYAPTMFPIVGQFACNSPYNTEWDYGSSTGSDHTYRAAAYGSASLVRVGTNESWGPYPISSKGCKSGTHSKISLLVDSKGNVGISSFHNYTRYSNPMVFLGPLYRKKLYDYDTLNQRYLCNFNYSVARGTDTTTSGAESYAYCAWYSNYSGAPTHFLCTNITTGNPATYTAYAAYPAVSNTVYTNYRYSKACYTTIGLIDEEVIRCSATDGLIRGQTFNDGDWCYIYGIGVQTGTTGSNLLYTSIRWDKDFNNHETFIDY